MIALAHKSAPKASRPATKPRSAWHDGFLDLLPTIQKFARIAFRCRNIEAQEEAVQETIANALVAYVRLVEQGKEDIVFAGPLVRYAVAQVRCGRRVAARLNIRDVLSEYCQRSKAIVVERLDQFNAHDGEWQEILVEDKRVTPADLAASRIDYPAFLVTLTKLKRRIAETLASGETPGDVARSFGLSRGRISQIRRELHDAWLRFHGDSPTGEEVGPVAR